MQNIFFLVLLAFTVSGCTEELDSTAPVAKLELESKAELKKEAPKMITLRGTVRYKNLEGGFWGLEGDDGNKYTPSGLKEAFLVDGMVVEVIGIIEENKNLMTIQQYGRVFKVIHSKIIDNSKARALNSY